MKIVFIATMLIIASSAVAQEMQHAPTLDACQADFNLWIADINRAAHGGTNVVPKLSFKDLLDRVHYIDDCQDANPSLKKNCKDEGLVMTLIYEVEMRNRLISFVKRHDFKEMFLAEDTSGKR